MKAHSIIKPLDTSESEIWIRDGLLGENAMPPLAKNLVDDQYIDVLTDWINDMPQEACVNVSVMDWRGKQSWASGN